MSDLSNQATTDYLKVIYEICAREGRAGTGQIAHELDVAPASVTGMLKKLSAAEPPLVDYRKHQGVALTEQGQRQALRYIRRHRLLECFLCEALGYSWDEVHEEAERLEHAISGITGRRIAEYLQEPERDPHGAPIPTRNLRVADDKSVGLHEVDAGQRVRVKEVNDRDAEVLRYLGERYILPGTDLVILRKPPSAEQTYIRVAGRDEEVVLREDAVRAIFVSLSGDD